MNQFPAVSERHSFQLKQFSVSHYRSSMKVGTDALILGAWAQHTNPRQILEIGCGCGIISLMLAQKYAQARITAIDIHADSVAESTENFKKSPWANRMTAIESNYLLFESDVHFDLIVCNPPFFNNDLQSPVIQRNNARHQVTFIPEMFFSRLKGFTNHGSVVCMITPYIDKNQWIKIAENEGWFLTHEVAIRPSAHKKNIRSLLAFKKKHQTAAYIEAEISTGAFYSNWYKSLMSDFRHL